MKNYSKIPFDNWTSILSKTRNAIVFENKNKEYGAYKIRQGYFKTLIRSYIVSIIFIFLLFYTPVIIDLINDYRNQNILSEKDFAELTKMSDILLSPPPEIEVTKPSGIPVYDIKKQDTVQLKPKTNTPDSGKAKQDSLLLAKKDSLFNDSINKMNDSMKLATKNANPDIKNQNGLLSIKVDALPEFPGGAQALDEYLRQHSKYTLKAKAMGTNGTVNVSFIVEADGSISNIRLMKVAGNGLDDQVVSTIKNMPRWKPGIFRQQPKRFIMYLPINYSLIKK
ncbi:MAG: TonB family protein [Bacteroidota bacterium]